MREEWESRREGKHNQNLANTFTEIPQLNP